MWSSGAASRTRRERLGDGVRTSNDLARGMTQWPIVPSYSRTQVRKVATAGPPRGVASGGLTEGSASRPILI